MNSASVAMDIRDTLLDAKDTLEQARAAGRIGRAIHEMLEEFVAALQREIATIDGDHEEFIFQIAFDINLLFDIIGQVSEGETRNEYQDLEKISRVLLTHVLGREYQLEVLVVYNPSVAVSGFASHSVLYSSEIAFILHVGDQPGMTSPPRDALLAHEVAHCLPEIDAKCRSLTSIESAREGEILCDLVALAVVGRFFVHGLLHFVRHNTAEELTSASGKHPSWAARGLLLHEVSVALLPNSIGKEIASSLHALLAKADFMQLQEQQFVSMLRSNLTGILSLVSSFCAPAAVLTQDTLEELITSLEADHGA